MNWEYQEQVAVARWIDLRYPHILWTASAGGMRTNMGTAIKMKRAGYKKGCPDILIFEPMGQYKGLMIEFKRDIKYGKTYPSPEQEEWIDSLNIRGYKALICRGYDEATRTIEDYFKPIDKRGAIQCGI